MSTYQLKKLYVTNNTLHSVDAGTVALFHQNNKHVHLMIGIL